MVFFRHDGNVHDDDHRLPQFQDLAQLIALCGRDLALGIIDTKQDQITQIQNLDRALYLGIKVSVGDVLCRVVISAHSQPGLGQLSQHGVQDA